MAMFVHLAFEAGLNRIVCNGISRSRRVVSGVPRGVFAVPVTRNFYISHQWLRELSCSPAVYGWVLELQTMTHIRPLRAFPARTENALKGRVVGVVRTDPQA
jgi:hypothetical protein